MTSKRLTLIAITLWFCSLALPGLVYYSDGVSYGYNILLMGWLGAIGFTFPWYANVFFWYAALRLKDSELNAPPPITSSIFAVLLSLTTFLFCGVDPIGGGSPPLYGYGWGAIVWMIAIFLLLIAVGKYQQEQKQSLDIPIEHDWLGAIGFFLIVITVGFSSYFFIQYRKEPIENSLERKRLSKVAFKLAKVCLVPEPTVKQPIQNLSGSLELIATGDNTRYIEDPSYDIRGLIASGIPFIRYAGIDYAITSDKYDGAFSISPAIGLPAAILKVFYSDTAINATLTEVSTKRVVFNQTWQKEMDAIHKGEYSDYFCPDFTYEEYKPLLFQALSLPKAPERNSLVKLTGVISKSTKKEEAIAEKHNIDCPIDIGWEKSNSHVNSGWSFRIKDKHYQYDNFDGYSSIPICKSDFIYVYHGYSHSGGYDLHIEKRQLSDFRQVWNKDIFITESSLFIANVPFNLLRIQEIEEQQNRMTIKVLNTHANEILSIQTQ